MTAHPYAAPQPDPVSAVTRALTEAQRDAIVERFTRLNPHYRGAEAADILDELDQTDSNLDKTDPLFGAHPELVVPGCGVAALALLWAGDPDQPLDAEAVEALLSSAGLLEG